MTALNVFIAVVAIAWSTVVLGGTVAAWRSAR